MENQDKINKEKIQLLYDSRKIVHVVLKSTKKWYNGKIKGIKPNSFIIVDKKGDFPILFKDVFKVEAYEKNIK